MSVAAQNAAAEKAAVTCSPSFIGATAEIYADVEVKDAETKLLVFAAAGEGDGMARNRSRETGGKDLAIIEGSIPMRVMFSRNAEIRSEPDSANTGKCKMRVSSGPDNFMILQEGVNGGYRGTVKITTESDYKIGEVLVARMLGTGTGQLRCSVEKMLASRVCDKGEVIGSTETASKDLPKPAVR